MSSDSEARRLTAALELWLTHKANPCESTAQFLQRHEALSDLLGPIAAAEHEADAAAPGEQDRCIGAFRLLREIGRGGMGVVYEAVQPALNRRVALKVLASPLAASPHVVARFRREAELLARLNHAHVVPVFEAGIVDGVPYHAMERIDGCTLADVLRQLAAPRPPQLDGKSLAAAMRTALVDESAGSRLVGNSHYDACLGCVLDIAGALICAHEHGILHRDVKPANVLLRRDGTALLSDFGLARDSNDPNLTRPGDFAGTPYYVSPEQAASDPTRVDARTDVFSLAVVLYELLLLQRPFDGDTTATVLERVQRAEPVALLPRSRQLPHDLAAVLERALQKDPDDRYASMAAFAADLLAVRELRPVTVRRSSVWSRSWQAWHRNPARTVRTLVLTVALATLVGLGIYVWQQSPRIAAAAARERLPRVESLIEQMLMQHEGGEIEAGLASARAAVELLPDLPEAVAAMVVASWRAGQPDESRAQLQHLRGLWPDAAAQLSTPPTAEPSTPLGWFVRGLRLVEEAHENGDQAVFAEAQQALRLAADRAESRRALFSCQYLHVLTHRREFDSVRLLADDLRHLWPQSPFVAYWCGFASEEFDADAAIEDYRRSMTLAPQFAQPKARLARLLAQRGQHDQALELYRAALQGAPGCYLARVGVARCLLALHREQEALVAAEQAVTAAPTYISAHVAKAEVLTALQQLPEALLCLDAAVAVGPKAAAPRIERAEFQIARGRIDAALADAEAACELEPKNPQAQAVRGVALLHANRPADAVPAFEFAVTAMPERLSGWRSLAQARRRTGDAAGARVAIDAALQLDANDVGSLRELGKLQRTLGAEGEAEVTFRRVLELDARDYESHVNLAGLAWRRSEREVAVELLAQARTIDPRWRDAWLPAFDFLERLGRTDEAIALRAEFCHQRPRERDQRLLLARRLLAASPVDVVLLSGTLDELQQIDGEERSDVAELRAQLGRAAARRN